MKTIIKIFAVAALSLTACGDNLKGPADSHTGDTGSGSGSGFPAAPTLGTQIDRMGRPAINTALNHTFDPNAGSAGSAKDAYNHDESVGTWVATWRGVFAPNLAIFDALDTGICGNGLCETVAAETNANCPVDCPTTGAINTQDGCGNQAFHDPNLMMFGYVPLATVLADDELYLETSKSNCAGYLAVEFYTQVLGLAVSNSCGGRAPSYDVIDTTYTLAAIGVKGFNPNTFAPAFGDTVDAHTDISDTAFPFLGAPH
ncbi:MAG: hypothetical protein JO257_29575 [Deltaproteobacteria bacterium]|nr:hypothetical protein [Deltaproteobacteria bacterium]